MRRGRGVEGTDSAVDDDGDDGSLSSTASKTGWSSSSRCSSRTEATPKLTEPRGGEVEEEEVFDEDDSLARLAVWNRREDEDGRYRNEQWTAGHLRSMLWVALTTTRAQTVLILSTCA